MTKAYDVIVVGVGATGAATVHALAARGVRVLGIEQFDVPHTQGSYHGDARAIRECYYEHVDYVPLLRRAYELWDELETTLGRRIRLRTGGLYLGRPTCDLLAGSRRAADAHGIPCELIEHADLRRRFGQFTVPDDHVGFFEPGAGVLLPEAIVTASVELALRAGADVHGREAVRTWSSGSDGIVVTTDRATYHAGRLVLCAGAWAGPLLSGAAPDVTLRPTRQVAGWVWPRVPEQFGLGTMPLWALGYEDGTMHYGFPLLPGRPGLKVGLHALGPAATPSTIDRTPTRDDEREIRDVLARRLPDADGALLSMQVCLYTSSPDQHFVVDHAPADERVCFACGLSGHGFKFATVLGEILADLAVDGRTRHPIDFLRAARLAAR